MSGKLASKLARGRISRKWKPYDKSSQREKGECPKAMKDVTTKAGNFWQRRVQFPFGDSEKMSEQKHESFGKGGRSFLLET